MLSITRRPLTDDEKRRLRRTLGVRPQVGPLVLGLYLVAVPVLACAASIFGLGVLHVPSWLAALLGLAAGVTTGAVLLLRSHRKEAALLSAGNEGLRQDLNAGAAQVWEFDVLRAWPVGEQNERGPGFLFLVDTDMAVYAATQALMLWGEGRFPTRRVAIHRLPHSKDILYIAAAGEPIPPEPLPIPRSALPVQGATESELLWRNGLTPSIQARLWG